VLIRLEVSIGGRTKKINWNGFNFYLKTLWAPVKHKNRFHRAPTAGSWPQLNKKTDRFHGVNFTTPGRIYTDFREIYNGESSLNM